MVDFRALDHATQARHLGNPEGEIGLAAAEVMNQSNARLQDAAFRRLGLVAGEQVFEVGFGNGKLIPGLLAQAPGLRYTGLDISPTMVEAATSFNRAAIAAGQVTVRLGACEDIPFQDGAFDRAVTVNTLYFWPEPQRCLAELRRVLRKGGVLLLAAMSPETAAKLPFARHGFRLYDVPALVALHEQAGFAPVAVEPYRETIPLLKGEGMLEREYHFVIAST